MNKRAAEMNMDWGDTRDLTAGGLHNVTHRSTDTAPKVQNVHPLLEANVLRDGCLSEMKSVKVSHLYDLTSTRRVVND